MRCAFRKKGGGLITSPYIWEFSQGGWKNVVSLKKKRSEKRRDGVAILLKGLYIRREEGVVVLF